MTEPTAAEIAALLRAIPHEDPAWAEKLWEASRAVATMRPRPDAEMVEEIAIELGLCKALGKTVHDTARAIVKLVWGPGENEARNAPS